MKKSLLLLKAELREQRKEIKSNKSKKPKKGQQQQQQQEQKQEERTPQHHPQQTKDDVGKLENGKKESVCLIPPQLVFLLIHFRTPEI